jgi:hypothetical protein
MKRLFIPAITVLVAACGSAPRTLSKEERVKRGEYLVTLGGCNDCHTPLRFDPQLGAPVPDVARRLSGHAVGAPEPEGTLAGHDMAVMNATMTAFKLPFGTVYARNLTPDKDTGLGRWTAEQFIQTFRTGRSMGAGRPLLPPMPWQNMLAVTDDDLRSMFAYLQSLPPIANPVPTPSVPPPVVDGFGESYQRMLSHADVPAEADPRTPPVDQTN